MSETMRETTRAPIDVVWDMETGDPDDFLTLLWLLDHPGVRLKAVTITPGTPDQVGMVRRAIYEWFGREDVRVGAFNLDHGKRCLSGWHTRAFGAVEGSRDAEHGPEVLLDVCDDETTLITGAPLKNLGEAIRLGRARGVPLRLGRWVAQGGFAGVGVVPEDVPTLGMFAGRTTCPTYNFNGAHADALLALDAPEIAARWLVSKNVCHRVVYDAALHARVTAARHQREGLRRVWEAMEAYLRKKPSGKKFHDPLAACCALDPEIGRWAQVVMYREGGAWGARLAPGSATQIIVDYDHARFVEALTAS